jgi:DNA-binding NtrC family response regulator
MRTIRLLLVDDEPDVVNAYSEVLAERGYETAVATSAAEAREIAARGFFDLLVLDERMPGMNGTEFFIECRRLYPGIGAIFITGNATVDSAVRALRAGALDLLQKPVEKEALVSSVECALAESQLTREHRYFRYGSYNEARFSEIISRSGAMKSVLDIVRKLIPTQVPVLIQGESGTGKELLARALHYEGPRRSAPFVTVNSGAIPATLVESLLFGHRKGAFTNATEGQKGFFEAARGGTIFLDEIGEMTAETQIRLLRVLEQKTITRVGETAEIPVDARIVAATNRNLSKEVAAGKFREDLYHRLNVFRVEVPPLRERRDDIEPLALHLLHRHRREIGKSVRSLSPAALKKLLAYSWPGNVRELSNVLQRSIILAETEIITPDLVMLDSPATTATVQSELFDRPWEIAKQAFAKEYFELLLERSGGNLSEAARFADVDRTVVYKHLKDPRKD